jgi:hypothetical protein
MSAMLSWRMPLCGVSVCMLQALNNAQRTEQTASCGQSKLWFGKPTLSKKTGVDGQRQDLTPRQNLQ